MGGYSIGYNYCLSDVCIAIKFGDNLKENTTFMRFLILEESISASMGSTGPIFELNNLFKSKCNLFHIKLRYCLNLESSPIENFGK